MSLPLQSDPFFSYKERPSGVETKSTTAKRAVSARPGLAAQQSTEVQPNKERPNCVVHSSNPAQRPPQQLPHHSWSSLQAQVEQGQNGQYTIVLEFTLCTYSLFSLSRSRFLHLRWCTVLQLCFSRSRRCRFETGKPKSIRGDRLELPTHSGGSDPQHSGYRSLLSVLLYSHSNPPIYYFLSLNGVSPTLLHQVYNQPSLSLINLYRDHIGLVSSESNSASDQDESTLCTLDSASFCFTPIRNRAHCVLERIRPRVDYVIFFTDNYVASSNIFVEPRQMENNDRILKELATPDAVYQLWCIQYPQLEPTQTYELMYDLIHLLPKFHGLAGEDPHKHLKEFHVVCSTMRP
ncbi:hypothetical protein CR513_02192, partial [Mucuna pruriens]